MTRQDKIIKELRKMAEHMFSNLPVSAYLYGSRARGDSQIGSDWDILILTDDSISDGDAYEKFAYPFTEFGWKVGERITPILYSMSEWQAEQNTSFYLNLQKDAIRL